MIEVLNKVDLLDTEARAALARRSDLNARQVVLSARTGEGIDALAAAIDEVLGEPVQEEVLTLGFGQGAARAWLFEQDVVERETQGDKGFRLRVKWTPRQQKMFKETFLKH